MNTMKTHTKNPNPYPAGQWNSTEPRMLIIIPTIELIPCSVQLELESRGLFSFHDYLSCGDCAKRSTGAEVHVWDSLFSPLRSYHPSITQAEVAIANAEPNAVVTVGQPVYYR